MRPSFFGACVLLSILLSISIATTAQVIPEAVKVNLQGRVPTEKCDPTPWSGIVVNQVNSVFSSCETGLYYAGFQLAYDLGDKSTATNWAAQVSIQLLHNSSPLWTRQLNIQMATQNFVSTIFHDSTIACGEDYEYKVTVKTPTGTVPPTNVELKVLLYRYDTASLDPGATMSLTCTRPDSTKTHLSWDAVEGADEYDIEWVFIDRLEGFTGTDPFSKGAGGVTVAKPGYDHQTFYPTGSLSHRIRAVGYSKENPEHRIVGAWATCAVIGLANQQEDITWQSQTVFAEDGKHKTSVKYLDPGMRERQTLVNLSTNDMTVVGETKYDYEGRPSINILPVPVDGHDLKYKDKFNGFGTADPLVDAFVSDVRKKFNYDNGGYTNTKISKDSIGAARYYSSFNASTITNSSDPGYYTGLKKNYLPDANGFVYSQTEYLHDGRNFVAKQSGVGEAFAMEGDHATKYFYAQPTQTELSRLFGANAGNASHYKKQITIDNNNQASVTYLDQEGRTIATALGGKSPGNLDQLLSNYATDTTWDISSRNKRETSRLIMTHKITNTVIPTEYNFFDSLSAYGATVGKFGCQTCSFNLRITVTDPDGVQIAVDSLQISAASCSAATNEDDISLAFTAGAIGDYTITKTLTPTTLGYNEVRSIVMANTTVTGMLSALNSAYQIPDDCKVCTDELKYKPAYEAIENAQNEIADLECQKLYNQMVRKWKKTRTSEPTLFQLDSAYSIAYDEWTTCKHNVRSDIFDKQLGRVPTWTAATAGGYNKILELDPFFHDSLAGAGYIGVMRGRLDNISIRATETTNLNGPLERITDPSMMEYYVDQNGRTDVVGVFKYHILYYDFMSKPHDGDYDEQLDTTRWVMFKNFYLEKKRLQKLDIFTNDPNLKNDSIKMRLQEKGLPAIEDEQDVQQFVLNNGGAITSVERDSVYNRLVAHCNVSLSPADETIVKQNLSAYFNSDLKNIFRDIFTEDLTDTPAKPINPNLNVIKTKVGASCLATFARSQYECLDLVTYYRRQKIINDTIERTTNSDFCLSAGVDAGCTYGWDSVVDRAYATDGELTLTANCSSRNDAVYGTFQNALIPYQKYRFKFRYKKTSTTNSTIRIQFGTGSSTYQPNTSSYYYDENNNIFYQCDEHPLLNPATGNGSTKQITNDQSTYREYYFDYTPNVTGVIYFFIDIQTDVYNVTATAVLTDFILELEAEACIKYATFDPFKYDVNWAANCAATAIVERDSVLNYAKNLLIEDQISEFYRSYNCLDRVSENLSYRSSTREYHYTLYYYDQAGNLVQTVPPNGVKLDSADAHSFLTNYKYNSYNQVVSQKTPDAGLSEFWYNNKTQLRVSRNARQRDDSVYSYSKYDNLGRVKEVGEITSFIDPLSIPDSVEFVAFPLRSENTLSDVTWTYYDSLSPLVQSKFPQENLRNRVSYTEVTDQQNVPGNSNNIRTYFSYDIHGNVKSLRQDIPGLPSKTVDYVYDLVSNKVNFVFFQFGKYSQFAHRYQYDADNRLTSVSTSTDRFIWNLDAKYDYYDHGPLARVEYGEHRVQGSDYFYTLQGWLKGVNMPFVGDPSADGTSPSLVGKDVTAFTLGYYNGDYTPVNAVTVNTVLQDNSAIHWSRWNSQFALSNGGLYNGNISWMITDLFKQGELKSDPRKAIQMMLYKYDQLNRITQSRSIGFNVGGFLAAHPGTNAAYDEKFSYDPNGNLLTLDRYSDTGTLKDDFDYHYSSGTNKLSESHPYLTDLNVTSGTLRTDNVIYRNIIISGTANVAVGSTVELKAANSIQMIPSFSAPQNSDFNAHIVTDGAMYEYDAIGNLITDNEKGTEITWNPQGKVRSVNVQNGLSITTFRYDAMGNRVEKRVVANSVTKITRYLRDASGNVMAVYNDTTMIEQPIYGSSRVGMYIGGGQDGKSIMNLRRYELTNHLGNVLSVISDKVTMSSTAVTATVLSTTDYYAFGSSMVGRTWSDPGLSYRYGFNGKEKDADTEWGSTEYDYGFRIYNPSLGKFLSVDPLTKEYPWYTPYQFAGNKPIWAIDIDGLEEMKMTDWQPLTYQKLKQLATQHDVWRQTQSNFQNLPPDKRYDQFKFRLGRIFEGAVLEAIGREKNTKRFYADPLDPSSTIVIPDAVVGSGTVEKKLDSRGRSEIHYFWWDEGTFIDAKTSESKMIPDSKQLRGFVDHLASEDNAETSTSGIAASFGWGTPISKNAAISNSAFLHLITTSGAVIDPQLIQYAKSKNVQLWQSETEVNKDGTELRVLPAVDRTSESKINAGSFLMGVQGGKLNYNQR